VSIEMKKMNEEEILRQIEILSEKSLMHSKILEQIHVLLEKIVKDLYGLELEEYVV
jgi:hypothetical protein